jgi:hypothetical protein
LNFNVPSTKTKEATKGNLRRQPMKIHQLKLIKIILNCKKLNPPTKTHKEPIFNFVSKNLIVFQILEIENLLFLDLCKQGSGESII